MIEWTYKVTGLVDDTAGTAIKIKVTLVSAPLNVHHRHAPCGACRSYKLQSYLQTNVIEGKPRIIEGLSTSLEGKVVVPPRVVLLVLHAVHRGKRQRQREHSSLHKGRQTRHSKDLFLSFLFNYLLCVVVSRVDCAVRCVGERGIGSKGY